MLQKKYIKYIHMFVHVSVKRLGGLEKQTADLILIHFFLENGAGNGRGLHFTKIRFGTEIDGINYPRENNY